MPRFPGFGTANMAQTITALGRLREERRARQQRDEQARVAAGTQLGGRAIGAIGTTIGALSRAAAEKARHEATLEANRPLRDVQEKLAKMQLKEEEGPFAGPEGKIRAGEVQVLRDAVDTLIAGGHLSRERGEPLMPRILAGEETALQEARRIRDAQAIFQKLQDTELAGYGPFTRGWLRGATPEELAAVVGRAYGGQITPEEWQTVVSELVQRMGEEEFRGAIPEMRLPPQEVRRISEAPAIAPVTGMIPFPPYGTVGQDTNLLQQELNRRAAEQGAVRDILLRALSSYQTGIPEEIPESAIGKAYSFQLPIGRRKAKK